MLLCCCLSMGCKNRMVTSKGTRKRRTRRQGGRRSRSHPSRRAQKGGQLVPSLRVEFGGAAGAAAAAPGPLLSREQTQQQPEVSWSPSSPLSDTLYSLVCIDPDAPAPNAPWLHWLVVNAAGSTPDSGDELVRWAPPTPPAGTGTHRYEFTLYRQVAALRLPPPPLRAGFDLQSFEATNRLEPLTTVEIRVASAVL